MNSILYFIAAFIFEIAAPQILTYTILPTSKLTLKCETTDLNSLILFKLDTFNKGGCISSGSCSTGIIGYETPTQITNITEMVITSCNETRDIGSWTCVYGGSTSSAVTIADCSGDTSTPTGNSSGDTSTPTGNSSGDTSTPTGNSLGDTSTPSGNSSGGTNTPAYIVPVTTVTITPAGDNNVVYIIEGEKHTFTCTTNYSRPAAWIQWYIGGQNVTNQATPQPPQQDGDKFISSSSLMYTGKDVDHNKIISCQAVNIEGRQKVNSIEKSLYIPVPVTTVTITPAGDNNVVVIIEGETQTFTCTTDSSRPAAWIQWYIGGQNVTNQATPKPPQQDGDKFISSSSLMYTGRDVDHNKCISCQALNIEGRQKVNSTEKSLSIQFQPQLNIDIPSSYELIALEIGMSLNITVNLLANPAPTIQWMFRRNDSTDSVIKSPSSSNGFEFTSHIFIQAINKTQFGSYIVIATNTIGSFNKTFSVIEQVRPTAPVVVYVVCQTTSAVVLWRSEFNGGSKQKLYVQYWRISQSSSSMLSPSIPDPGVTADLQYTVNNLLPDTVYIFHIIAGNEFGDSLSKSVECTTDKRQNPATTCQDSNGLFAAGISTLVIGLLSIIFAVSFTVFCRLRRQTKEQIRSNDYTEFKKCTRCNPVVTDSYDSLNTTTIGTTEVNENQTDINIATYEEIKPSENTANTNQHQTKLPIDVIKKQEGIYDNMKH